MLIIRNGFPLINRQHFETNSELITILNKCSYQFDVNICFYRIGYMDYTNCIKLSTHTDTDHVGDMEEVAKAFR
ncbi:hypothetical protein, partial [Streptococcus iniae]|uniref:hypothetical protein n=1 Tax=Streptococcus iniae TaxID=1346 RepID=UPI002877F093